MKGGQLCDTFTGFGVADPTMLERLKRDVRQARSDCVLGFISRWFLSDVLLFEVERRWWELDNIVGSVAIIEKVYKRSKRWRRNIRCYRHNSFVCLLNLAERRPRSLRQSLFIPKRGDVMSTFGIVVLLCFVLAFIELHRWSNPVGLRWSANKENRAVLIS